MAGDGIAKHVIGVGSGKGGVGKTTSTLNLALALRDLGHRVGVLDADLYGPNVPQMLGLTRPSWSREWTLARRGGMRIEPVAVHGLRVMSAGFILAEDQPMRLPGATARTMIRQLLRDTEWGAIDYLLVDLPPGTGDVQQVVLQEATLDSAIIVVTPQYIAHLDARKSVQMYRAEGIPILGGIENMAHLRCPHCGERVELFPPVPEARSVWAMDVARLAAVPFDPVLSRSADRGRNAFDPEHGNPVIAGAFLSIAAVVEQPGSGGEGRGRTPLP